ncbi:uncharacterized protein LOC132760380 [Ruditapes philippinarum]|uniref:uncharacterized protein LOC132760380 n=1 Tax=Ruditapes philippinarum TaxID=129788 RepID=UPI00295AA6D0|nr:uncharacterized protein LOC132760380 [Ruditapes philippinarum]
MAGTVAISTLIVLLSNSERDMENLWNTLGPLNDPMGNKHEVDLALAVHDGNFRSALIDDWVNQSFTNIYIQGTNKFGDILWETEFDVTGKSWTLDSWLSNGNILTTSSLLPGTQDTTFGNQNYRFRISPSGSADTSWFAVTFTGLSYGPLPRIFVPRSPDVPFSLPAFIDGNLGCWNKDMLLNVHLMFSNDTMTPTDCIAACVGNASTAIITVGQNCFCADLDPLNPPINNASNCYIFCSSTIQLCGGFSDNFGNAYHIQGHYLPGYINISLLFMSSYEISSNTIEIDVSEISVGNQISPAFISNISVKAIPLDQYSVQYSTSNCSHPGGNMKDLSFDAVTTKIFEGDGSVTSVDILMIRCLQIQFVTIIPNIVHVQLWGPDVSSEHIIASALVIRGTSEAVTTSSSTTSLTTTAPTTTTTSAPAAATTTTVSTTTASTNTSNSVCYCPCNSSDLTLTDEQLQDKLDEIKRNLTMNVSNLSSRIRKLTSAEDKRVSAVSIGYVGVGILVVIFSAIVFIDSSLLYKDIKKFVDNIKNGICCKIKQKH